MYLSRLQLQNFRSYAGLDLPLTPGLTLVVGDNAAGKSNLLEAAYMLAALRSPRTSADGELIAWGAEPPGVARIVGEAEGAGGPVKVEIAVGAQQDAAGRRRLTRTGAPLTSKRIRINGVARRAADALGAVHAVLFTTLDIEILSGPPLLRRRYLDFTVAQYESGYARAASRYARALQQRNALLKRLNKGQGGRGELGPWDDVLIEEGTAILAARAAAVAALSAHGASRHTEIAPTEAQRELRIAYLPALGGDDTGQGEWPQRLRAALETGRRRDIASGMTRAGPHRDDLAITLDGHDLGAYGSRAQQRSAALALRMAEADLLRERTGEPPVLLLDDLFSELDTARRESTATALRSMEQILLTTADPASVPAALPPAAAAYLVRDGTLVPGD